MLPNVNLSKRWRCADSSLFSFLTCQKEVSDFFLSTLSSWKGSTFSTLSASDSIPGLLKGPQRKHAGSQAQTIQTLWPKAVLLLTPALVYSCPPPCRPERLPPELPIPHARPSHRHMRQHRQGFPFILPYKLNLSVRSVCTQ